MKLWLAGELAERYRVYKSTVRNWCRDGTFPHASLETKGTRKYWVVPESDLENFTPRSIGGVRKDHPAPLTIVQRAQKARAKIRSSHGYGKTEIPAMIALTKDGVTAKEIARRFGIDEQTLEDILAYALIKPPKQKRKLPAKRKLKRVPEDLLRRLYEEEKRPTAEILQLLKTNYAGLYINLRHFGIRLRSGYHRRAAAGREELLRHLFLEQNLTPNAIAERLNLTEGYVKRKLAEFQISKLT